MKLFAADRHKRKISAAEAREYCEGRGVALIETSTLDDSNVDLAFEQVNPHRNTSISKQNKQSLVLHTGFAPNGDDSNVEKAFEEMTLALSCVDTTSAQHRDSNTCSAYMIIYLVHAAVTGGSAPRVAALRAAWRQQYQYRRQRFVYAAG